MQTVRPQRNQQPRRTRRPGSGGTRPGSGGASKILIVIVSVVVLGLLGWGVWALLSGGSGRFSRSTLDAYVNATPQDELLDDGAGVYIDLSNGMNYAYAQPEYQQVLQSVVNKLAANDAISFYGLSAGKISDPIKMSHTQLYNYLMNKGTYSNISAPIEGALAEIVHKGQPALLMTDFEEYQGNTIQRAAFAKQYFIAWLQRGYTITFFKWDFAEGNKAKHMYLAVFDDGAARLLSMVQTAIAVTGAPVDCYTLGGKGFNFPITVLNNDVRKGLNFHDVEGNDLATAVQEGGGAEDYICYPRSVATATGEGVYLPLNSMTAPQLAEYYPLGVNWADAVQNFNSIKSEYYDERGNLMYANAHLIDSLFVNFKAQSGYEITGVEARVFDMQPVMDRLQAMLDTTSNASADDILAAVDGADAPELQQIFVASMEDCAELPGYSQLMLDFHGKFTGAAVGDFNPSHLLRVNYVISEAQPVLDYRLEQFFGSTGNPSLLNSVKETLTNGGCSPVGRVLFSFYFKSAE
ncbi:MAG: hypothetical protein ACI4AM_00615 [Muribaculaceae bacterium]